MPPKPVTMRLFKVKVDMTLVDVEVVDYVVDDIGL
jgi:hypothetical protein